jgi:hypothetical protein
MKVDVCIQGTKFASDRIAVGYNLAPKWKSCLRTSKYNSVTGETIGAMVS